MRRVARQQRELDTGVPDRHAGRLALMLDLDEGKLTPAERENTQRTILVGFFNGTLMIAFSVAVMSLTAIFTVLLIVASRAVPNEPAS